MKSTEIEALVIEMMEALNETFDYRFVAENNLFIDKETSCIKWSITQEILSFCLGFLAAKGLRGGELELGSCYLSEDEVRIVVEVLERGTLKIHTVGWLNYLKDPSAFGVAETERPISFYGLKTVEEINVALKAAGYPTI